MSVVHPTAKDTGSRMAGRPDRLVGLLLAGLGFILTAWAYGPALEAGFYFDDESSILDNPAVHWESVSWDNVLKLQSAIRLPRRFTANLSFGLNHVVGGLDPFGYHAVNVLIHLALGVALIWLAMLYLAGKSPSVQRGRDVAVVAVIPVILFLVHPLNTQAITYAVQRMASLAALFSVLALAAYLTGRRSSRRAPTLAWWLLALVCWVLALGSKENAAALPLVVVTYEWSFHRAFWWSRIRELASRPRTRLAAGTLVTVAVVVLAGVALSTYVGRNPISLFKEWPAHDFNGYERVLTQTRVHLLYLGLVLWPSPTRLNLDHDFTVSRALLDPPTTLFAVLFWIAFVVFAIYLGLRRPRYGFPLLAYLGLHLIESGPVNLELVFEHRMYLPMTMLVPLGAVVLFDLLKARGVGLLGRRATHAFALTIAILLAVATHARNQVWADPIALHQDIARKSPDKMRTHVNLGAALLNAGRAQEAFDAFQRALELSPNSYASHVGLGNAYLELARPAEALPEYQEAVRINPERFEARYNIGLALKAQGLLDEAIEYYSYVGTRLGMAGRAHEALRFLAKAVELRPERSASHNALGNAYLMLEWLDQALEEYDKAVELDSANAEAVYNTGMVLERLGRLDEAETRFRQFVEIAPPSLAPQAAQLRQRFGIPRRGLGSTRP